MCGHRLLRRQRHRGRSVAGESGPGLVNHARHGFLCGHVPLVVLHRGDCSTAFVVWRKLGRCSSRSSRIIRVAGTFTSFAATRNPNSFGRSRFRSSNQVVIGDRHEQKHSRRCSWPTGWTSRSSISALIQRCSSHSVPFDLDLFDGDAYFSIVSFTQRRLRPTIRRPT